jgi:hypothetical protein
LAAHIGAYLAENRYFRRPEAERESEEQERARSGEDVARTEAEIARTLGAVIVNDPEHPDGIRQRHGIKSRTARNWLHRLGYSWKDIKKGVFYDGHERPDVVQARKEFLQELKEMEPYLVEFNPDGTMKEKDYPADCKVFGEKRRPVIIIVHDESTFHANDGRHQAWMQDGHTFLRPKGSGKGIMISEFLLPWQRLNLRYIPEADRKRLNDAGVPSEATEVYEYGSGKGYWDGEDLLKQVVEKAQPIAQALYPGYEIVWIFDNATSHSVFKGDALSSKLMGLNPGGVQPHLRNGWYIPEDSTERIIHPMVYTNAPSHLLNVPGAEITWIPKGLKRVLQERGLWPEQGLLLQCDRPKCSDCTTAENCKVCVKGTRCNSCREAKQHSNNSCKPNRKCDGCVARKERCTCIKKKKCPRCQAIRAAGKCEACELLPPRCTSNCE